MCLHIVCYTGVADKDCEDSVNNTEDNNKQQFAFAIHEDLSEVHEVAPDLGVMSADIAYI